MTSCGDIAGSKQNMVLQCCVHNLSVIITLLLFYLVFNISLAGCLLSSKFRSWSSELLPFKLVYPCRICSWTSVSWFTMNVCLVFYDQNISSCFNHHYNLRCVSVLLVQVFLLSHRQAFISISFQVITSSVASSSYKFLSLTTVQAFIPFIHESCLLMLWLNYLLLSLL